MNESLTEAVKKRYQEAGFTNDLIFKQVLRNNPDILQEVLQICIPGIDASAFTIAESEHEIIVSIGNKRIRLDLITKSQSGDKVVDLEMFTYDPDLPMYARYAGLLTPGTDPSDLLHIRSDGRRRSGIPAEDIVRRTRRSALY